MWTSHQGVEHENTMWGIITVAWLALPLLLHLIMAHFACDQPKIPHRYHIPMDQFIFFVANFSNTHSKKKKTARSSSKTSAQLPGELKRLFSHCSLHFLILPPLKSPPWFSKSSLFETAVNINCNKTGFQIHFTEIFFLHFAFIGSSLTRRRGVVRLWRACDTILEIRVNRSATRECVHVAH